MTLECLTKETNPINAEVNESQKAFEPADETNKKQRTKVLFCLLCLAILFALNTAYNFSVAEADTPVLQTIMKNPVFDFAGTDKENPLLRKEAINSIGVVKGILHNENNPTALIGTEMLHEGAIISGAKVIKIHKDRVEFEKDGFAWTQHVMEIPE